MTTFCGPIHFHSAEEVAQFCVFDAIAACVHENGRDVVGFLKKEPVYAKYDNYEWEDDGEMVTQIKMTAYLD